jgi:DNA-binding NtrC family response regulator
MSIQPKYGAQVNFMDRKNILVLRDDWSIQFEMEYIINSSGYRAVSISSIDKALTAFNHDPSICLILIDGEGPHWPLTAAKFMEQRAVPVIFWTGEKDHETFSRMRKTLPKVFVIKKSEKNVLMSFIKLAIEH